MMSDLVLWGHDAEDYQEMFDLTPDDLSGSLLEFGCGPSAFNSEMQHRAKRCVSCDPMFCLDADTLKTKSLLVFADRVERVAHEMENFDFSQYNGFEGLVAHRRAGMEKFLADYTLGKQEKRYQPVQDLSLPFADFSFDLALSSHYLFGELDNQDLEFHVQAIKELARVAIEVRFFPLVDHAMQTSPFLGPVLLALQQDNYGVEVRSVNYSLQPKGNAMLRVWALECHV
jgi:SAM-dependent methyltransferase